MSQEERLGKIRSERKRDHVHHFYKNNYAGDNYFEDIMLMHNALPEIDFNKIDTSTVFLGKEIRFPLLINAMTGGFDEAVEINRTLAQIAGELEIPMAVGSQSIAVKNSGYEESFKVVREAIGEGVVISNMNGFATLDEIDRAIDMLEADGLQIHLNPAQEICMKEGDRDFTGVLKNIESIVNHLDVPVIVKEVGFGISGSTAKKLYEVGAAYVDVAGSGGTNFIQIEDQRNLENDYSEFYQWGIPTAMSLIECAALDNKAGLTASGGIKSADQIIKSLIIGADMVGMSGTILRCYMDSGYQGTKDLISDLIYKSKVMMLLLGAHDIESLKNIPYRIKGELWRLVNHSVRNNR